MLNTLCWIFGVVVLGPIVVVGVPFLIYIVHTFFIGGILNILNGRDFMDSYYYELHSYYYDLYKDVLSRKKNKNQKANKNLVVNSYEKGIDNE